MSGQVQIGGAGPVRYARLPINTIQVRPNAVCASLKGLPFDPCFNLEKTDAVSFRGSVSGMSFAYCSFRRHGNSIIETRVRSRPRPIRRRSCAVRSNNVASFTIEFYRMKARARLALFFCDLYGCGLGWSGSGPSGPGFSGGLSSGGLSTFSTAPSVAVDDVSLVDGAFLNRMRW